MELKYDWKVFNAVLFPQEHWETGPRTTHGANQLVLLKENDEIVNGLTSHGVRFQDFGIKVEELNKSKLDSLASKYGVEQTVIIDRKALKSGVQEAQKAGVNYFRQLEIIKAAVTEKEPSLVVSRHHYILNLLTGTLKKVLPHSYTFLIFIDTSVGGAFSYKSLLLQMKDGQLEYFFEPDFSSLHENRLEEWDKQADIIGEYLQSRYILPCYAIFLKKEVWTECNEAASKKRSPWKIFSKATEIGRATHYPRSFLPNSLLAFQKIMMYFSRN